MPKLSSGGCLEKRFLTVFVAGDLAACPRLLVLCACMLFS